jgi:hypothetical protein
VLHGLADTLNCGEYGFSRYNTQLLVFRLGTQRREGGEYDVSRLPRHRWAGLVGRDHVPLNAIVFRDDDAIRILAGDVPAQPHMLDSLR